MTLATEPGRPSPAPRDAAGSSDPTQSAHQAALPVAFAPIRLGESTGENRVMAATDGGVVITLEAHAPMAHDVFARLESGQVVTVVQQLEALKAWVDYVSLAATAELTHREERIALDEAGPDASATTRDRAAVESHSATADELVLATGIGYRDALSRVLFSIADPTRVQDLRDRLRAGAVPWHRARALHDECRHLPAPLAAEIADAVLEPAPGGAALSGGLFRQRLTRRLARANDTATSRAHTLAARTLGVLINPDGTGTLTLTAAAARLRGAHQRIDAIARRLRAAGSSRTLAQLRSDIALDLLLYGQIPTTATAPSTATSTPAATATTATPAGTTVTTATATTTTTSTGDMTTPPVPPTQGHRTAAAETPDVPGERTADAGRRDAGGRGRGAAPTAARTMRPTPTPTPTPASPPSSSPSPSREPHGLRVPGDGGPIDVPDVSGFDPDSTACSFDPALFKQQLPPAQVTVTVALSTLLGLDHEPGTLTGADGIDYLDADTIRAAAMTAGSTWRRLITDPLTGHAVELSTHSYTPGDRLTRAVCARDLTCRVPGCTAPAQRCDLDHDVDYDLGGATDLANLSAKHRRHHNHKTTGRWRSDRDGDVITWTTGAGRTYSSYPADYRPMEREPSTTTVESRFDLILAHAYRRPIEFHPDGWLAGSGLEEKPPPPAPPPPVDPGPPPF